MITVLVKYQKWNEPSHPQLDGWFEEISEIIEVEKLTDINNAFPNIIDVKKI